MNPWVMLAMSAAAVLVTAYAVLVTAYAVHQIRSLGQDLEAVNANVAELDELQRSTNELREAIESLGRTVRRRMR